MGIAIGDSLGLPFEGLSASRVAKRLRGRALKQSLLFGRGMLSDDTEQSCLITEAVLQSQGDPIRFQKYLARKLRAWFLAIPPGVGMATVRACLKLIVGVSPSKAGVPSAGNGSAMRAPMLGVLLAHDLDLLEKFVKASSEITHSDPRAIDGAKVVAFATAQCRLEPRELLASLSARCESQQWAAMLDLMADRQGSTPEEFAREIGAVGKVSGYVLHSVPVALFIWLSRPTEPEAGLEEVIRLGGDTDTTAAMLGALYGASLGAKAFPAVWWNGVADWPRSRSYLQALASAGQSKEKPPRVFWPACLVRNVFQLLVVLAHGFRRLLP